MGEFKQKKTDKNTENLRVKKADGIEELAKTQVMGMQAVLRQD